MSSSDEEIQKLLENKGYILPGEESMDDQDDLKIYSRLFDELIKAPEEKLSFSFSANVVRTISRQKQRRSEITLALLVAFLVITGLAGFASSAYFKEVLPSIAGSKWIIFAGLLALAVIQFLDQKLVLERRLPK